MNEVKEIFIGKEEAITLLAILAFVNKHKSTKYNLSELEEDISLSFDIGDVDLEKVYPKINFVPLDARVTCNNGDVKVLLENVEIHYNG